jgi:hypothetical protein
MFALIHTPRPKRRTGKYRARSPRYDCGTHGKLTAEQIERVAGLTRSGVRQRLLRGMTGDALVAPKLSDARGEATASKRPAMALAYKLATLYPSRVPSLAEIQQARPMTEKSAYRWQDAARRALESVTKETR